MTTPTPVPEHLPDRDQLARFAAALWQPKDIIELRAIFPNKSQGTARQRWARADALANDDSLAWIRGAQAEGRSIYAGINPRRAEGGASAADVVLARAVCVDIEDSTAPAVLAAIRDADLPDPSIVLASGGGVHVYWRLDEPLTDLDRWRTIQRGLIRSLDALPIDKKIHDPPRVMRLPGTLNVKRGQPARLIEAQHDRRYPLAEFPSDSPTVGGGEEQRQEIQVDHPPVGPVTPVVHVPPAIPASPASPVPPEALAVFEGHVVKGLHQRRDLVLRMVRRLKFQSNLGQCGPGPYLPHVRAWHRQNAAHMSGNDSEDETVLDFVELWRDLTVSIYSGIHADAFRLARGTPAPEVDAVFSDPLVGLLASTCFHLDRLFKGVAFGLSVSCVESELKVSRSRAHRLIRLLCAAQWIECVERRRPGPAGSPASRYVFLGRSSCNNGRTPIDLGDADGE